MPKPYRFVTGSMDVNYLAHSLAQQQPSDRPSLSGSPTATESTAHATPPRKVDEAETSPSGEPPKKKQKRNKPTLSCEECVERKTKVRISLIATCYHTLSHFTCLFICTKISPFLRLAPDNNLLLFLTSLFIYFFF